MPQPSAKKLHTLLQKRPPRIGIALGGGGARGFAHLSMLSVLDELALRPAAMAGTSMGAIIGTLYAAGKNSEEIRTDYLNHIITKQDTVRSAYHKRKELLKWFEAFKLQLGSGGIVNAQGVINYLLEEVEKETFEDMEIPLTIIASDYWSGEEVRFTKGEVLPAVQASMAIPGVFTPVEHDGRVLVDGGIVNQVPYNALPSFCDITIAIDVGGIRSPEKSAFPSPMNALLGSFEIAQDTVSRLQRELSPPTVYVRPPLENIGVLEFERVEEVLALSDLCRAELTQKINEAIAQYYDHQPPFSGLFAQDTQ